MVGPLWPAQPWFRPLIDLAEQVVILDKSSKVFLPVNKFNRSFAKSTRWRIMILKIKPNNKT